MLVNPDIEKIYDYITKALQTQGTSIFISVEDNVGKEEIIRELKKYLEKYYVIEIDCSNENNILNKFLIGSKQEIKEIIFLTRNCDVLLYLSKKDKKLDEEKVKRMLSTIEDWIKTSFDRKIEKELKRFDSGTKKIIVEYGKNICVVGTTEIETIEIRDDLRKILDLYERLPSFDEKNLLKFKSELYNIFSKKYLEKEKKDIDDFILYLSNLSEREHIIVIFKNPEKLDMYIEIFDKIAEEIITKQICVIVFYESKEIENIAKKIEILNRGIRIKYSFKKDILSNYGIKTVEPFLIVRVPKYKVNDISDEDIKIITEKTKQILNQKINYAFIVAEDDYNVMNINQFIKKLISASTIGVAIDTITRTIKRGGAP